MFRERVLISTLLCAIDVLATPLIERDTHPKYTIPTSYAALGDSYASGLGSGFFTNNSRDGLDGMLMTRPIPY